MVLTKTRMLSIPLNTTQTCRKSRWRDKGFHGFFGTFWMACQNCQTKATSVIQVNTASVPCIVAKQPTPKEVMPEMTSLPPSSRTHTHTRAWACVHLCGPEESKASQLRQGNAQSRQGRSRSHCFVQQGQNLCTGKGTTHVAKFQVSTCLCFLSWGESRAVIDCNNVQVQACKLRCLRGGLRELQAFVQGMTNQKILMSGLDIHKQREKLLRHYIVPHFL
eukprot:1158531-Pelagomonas_calceolata.AAC.6